MIIDPTLFAILVGLLGASIVLLVYFIIIALVNSSRLKKSEMTSDELRNEAKDIQNKIFLKAQEDYAEIISAADQKAEEIVKQTSKITSDSNTAFEKTIETLLKNQYDELNKKASEIEKGYEKEMQEANENNIKVFSNITKEVLDYTNSQFAEYKKTLEAMTIDARKLAETKANEEFKKMEADIEAYKKERIEKIDNNIFNLLLSVSKIAIGKSLTVNDQKNLILEALEQAKKEGALDYKNNG
ncbi:MAG TPA: hypothetical protein VG917_05480 [Patescibacteria group bacterium]|nr:hypothetical protein [Patescibacteria group bacterium]